MVNYLGTLGRGYTNEIKICIGLPVLEILDVAIVQKTNKMGENFLR